jgi:hypothetical protein
MPPHPQVRSVLTILALLYNRSGAAPRPPTLEGAPQDAGYPTVAQPPRHVQTPTGHIPITALSPDGLVVTTQGEVRAIAGKWKVLVTMDIPTTPRAFRADLLQVTRVAINAPVTSTVRKTWTRRLAQVERSLSIEYDQPSATPILSGQTRKPRGILDPLGVLVHDIFGLATTAEITNIKTVLRSLGENQNAIVNKFELLTTVVNRSRVFEQENRAFLNKLSLQFSTSQRFLYNLTRQFSLLTLQISMDQVITDLELRAGIMHDVHTLYAHRRQDLHNLKLTEELLSVTSLRTILSAASTYDSVPIDDVNWYYTHESVRPLWATPKFLVFEVDLHLVRPSTFLLYRIQGWPVPSGDSLTVQIIQTGEFGYDTNSGQLFEATHCTGKTPKVCSAGALFKAKFPPCVRGILKGDHTLMGECSVQVKSGTTSQLAYLSDNEYILSTWGDILEARCTGQNARTLKVGKGVHHILLPPSCSLSGPAWTISAVALHHLQIHLISRQLPRPNTLNLSALLDTPSTSLPLVSPLLTMSSIPPMPLAALHHTVLLSTRLKDEPDHLVRDLLIAATVTLVVLAISYIACTQRTRCQTWCARNDTQTLTPSIRRHEEVPGQTVATPRSESRPRRSRSRSSHRQQDLLPGQLGDPSDNTDSRPVSTSSHDHTHEALLQTASTAGVPPGIPSGMPDALFHDFLRTLHVHDRRPPMVTYSRRKAPSHAPRKNAEMSPPARATPVYQDLHEGPLTTETQNDLSA